MVWTTGRAEEPGILHRWVLHRHGTSKRDHHLVEWTYIHIWKVPIVFLNIDEVIRIIREDRMSPNRP